MNAEEARREIGELSQLLRRYQHGYYVLGRSEVSDSEYDRLFDTLQDLEHRYPELILPDSPTKRVGSDLTFDFPEVDHSIPVLSLDKTYTTAELVAWMTRLKAKSGTSISFVAEEKIDGVSIVLYYEDGVLARAVTRGNGLVGNDVTPNVQTVGAVPLSLPEAVDVAVRGEIFLPLKDFERINTKQDPPYANPRNLAAGTLRRIKSSDVAGVPLDILVYEGFFSTPVGTHCEILKRLQTLGFKTNPHTTLFTDEPEEQNTGSCARTRPMAELEAFIREETEGRRGLPYEIDGLVIKVNELAMREDLGYTGHHPRWAMAYKFEAPQGVTVLMSIDVQVGRTGRITPVARVKPVVIGGSTIRNVTLHNADYISLLEAAPGDTVAISRRGDVIPAVERVIEKGGLPGWDMPEQCPSCGKPLTKRGAHHFCRNRKCPAQVRGRLLFFVGRGQMDMDGLGPETLDVLIDNNFVGDIEDLFSFDYSRLTDFPGFGDKKVALISGGLEAGREKPYRTVLKSLGIPELGAKAAELLTDAGFRSIDDLLSLSDADNREALTAIDGIGEKTAEIILEELRRPELRRQIEALRRAGLQFEAGGEEQPELPEIFAGQTWCVTGSFEHFNPRSLAMEEVKRRGGKTTGQVSGKTTHLLAGSGAGSKLTKARELGIRTVTEQEFISLLEGDHP